MTEIEYSFPRGKAPVQVFATHYRAQAPVVLLFMDAFGPRAALNAIAENLANEGCRVLLPDLFYDHRPYVPLNPQSIFTGGEDRQRLSRMFGALDQTRIDADVRALLSVSKQMFGADAPIAAAGYCMGGRFALTAAGLSDQVVLAASFHGSNLAPATGEGAHTRVKHSRARLYIGVAEADPTFGSEEEGRLAAALREANVDHVIETYAGAAHGFVMSDLPVYDPASSRRHFQRLQMHLRETLERAR